MTLIWILDLKKQDWFLSKTPKSALRNNKTFNDNLSNSSSLTMIVKNYSDHEVAVINSSTKEVNNQKCQFLF